MRTFKRIAGFIIVNLVVVVSLTFMLAQPSVLKILLKEAKNAECDTLIIGESHGETSYDPYVMSDVKDLVAENFNSVDDMVAMLEKLGA